MGFLLQKTALHEFLPCESFGWVAVTEQSGPLPRGSQVLPGSCSSTGSSLHRATGPDRILFQGRLPKGLQTPSNIYLLQRGSSTGSRWIFAPLCIFVSCRGTAASPWAAPWAAGEAPLWVLEPSCPSSFTDPGVSADLFLPHILTPLCILFCSYTTGFSPP